MQRDPVSSFHLVFKPIVVVCFDFEAAIMKYMGAAIFYMAEK